jgi:hypothetical protein
MFIEDVTKTTLAEAREQRRGALPHRSGAARLVYVSLITLLVTHPAKAYMGIKENAVRKRVVELVVQVARP